MYYKALAKDSQVALDLTMGIIEDMIKSKISYKADWDYLKVFISTRTLKCSKQVVKLTRVMMSVPTKHNMYYKPLIYLEPEPIYLKPQQVINFKGYYVYFRPLKANILKGFVKHLRFSHCVLQLVNDLEEAKEDKIVAAVFNQLYPILGFPYRFSNGKENMKRREFIHKVGGRKQYVQKIYDYLESNKVILSISYVFFLKNEVLKKEKVEIEEKVRSIIAQDPITYFNGMVINEKQNKKFDPLGEYAIGFSSMHAMSPKIFELHNQYDYHVAIDITAMDSTMKYCYLRMLKKVQKNGYQNYHPYCSREPNR
ncbi:16881_t:CDS:2 [Gigaspora rosea]|nr:16881_t:CDS:2 [Gigaspora rosea]